ncbi:FAD-dependent thymidylate synthase [Patescibacteria group bacterium]|nr:FAD-dependent thymidylate synthase [Patescibacteria group bacterium]MBU1890297.1 FAD-dependent thymidylate synthase [Patescibacteria group bacterium]
MIPKEAQEGSVAQVAKMAKITKEEIKLLNKYVTDPTGNVFCIKGMEGLVGAAYARYSRARGGFRETLLKEFIKEGVIDAQHAEELIQRVLIAFGDDSVGELEGAHLSFENMSILATKEMEECRIGGSPIEQSTRYVFYDQKDDQGNYKYYRDPKIMASQHADSYVATMDFLFDTYCELIEPMKKFYKNLKPMDQAEYDIKGDCNKQKYSDLKDEKCKKAFRMTYTMDIRTRDCDTLRYILPISTTTNVGWFGNGRFYQGLLSNLYSSPYTEAQDLGKAGHKELNKVIPAYVRRAKKDDYRVTVEKNMYKLAEDITKDIEAMPGETVGLVADDANYIAHKLGEGYITLDKVEKALQGNHDNMTLAMMLYPYTNLPLKQLKNYVVKNLSEDIRKKIIITYIGQRRSRRDRPYRALEGSYAYTFDLVTDWGVYKDLMRHRMTSQLRQRFSPLLGFEMPPDIIEAGFEDMFSQCHEKVLELYNKLYADFPDEASYATLHGNKNRWILAFNEREAYHLLELRTTPQGHTAYRKIAQEMHKAIKKKSSWRADNMNFVDYGDYKWARGDSEARQRVKENELDKKYKKK